MQTLSHKQVQQSFRQCQRLLVLMPTKHLGNLLVSLTPIIELLNSSSALEKTLVIDTRYRKIIEHLDIPANVIYFDRSLFDNGSNWQKLRAGLGMIRRLRRLKPQLAIDIEGEITSGMLTRASGASVRVTPKPTRREFCYNAFIQLGDGREPLSYHKYYDYATVANYFGAQCPEGRYPSLSRNPDQIDQVRQILSASGADLNKPLITLQAGATKLYKIWSTSYFAELADWLQSEGYQVAFSGAGKIDRDKVSEIIEKMQSQPADLVNQLNLDQLLALQQLSSLFIGNDSGPAHLATAAGTKSICLFGPTNEKVWGTLGDSTTILKGRQNCAEGCSTKRCLADYRCMSSLDVALVQAEVKRLMQMPSPQMAEP